jgi:peptide-methionine (S)-S-oxide reductase
MTTTGSAPPVQSTQTAQTAIFGGGCFWCLEAVFQRTTGVTHVQSGYMGGSMAHPDYPTVCGKQTGHAEVVLVDYAPDQISYGQLLDLFFTIHDPTTPNRQGNDVGPQYRSMIFATTPEQSSLASQTLTALKDQGVAAVTEVVDVSAHNWRTALDASPTLVVDPANVAFMFWPAEPEHDSYFNRNPGQGYCVFVVAPKVIKAQQAFPALVQD